MKKWKLTALLISQALLSYAIFIVTIHSPKSKYEQVQEKIGTYRDSVIENERKLNSIIFSRAHRPSDVTIEATNRKKKDSAHENEFPCFTTQELKFLVDLASGK